MYTLLSILLLVIAPKACEPVKPLEVPQVNPVVTLPDTCNKCPALEEQVKRYWQGMIELNGKALLYKKERDEANNFVDHLRNEVNYWIDRYNETHGSWEICYNEIAKLRKSNRELEANNTKLIAKNKELFDYQEHLRITSLTMVAGVAVLLVFSIIMVCCPTWIKSQQQ